MIININITMNITININISKNIMEREKAGLQPMIEEEARKEYWRCKEERIMEIDK